MATNWQRGVAGRVLRTFRPLLFEVIREPDSRRCSAAPLSRWKRHCGTMLGMAVARDQAVRLGGGRRCKVLFKEMEDEVAAARVQPW
jgi:hypothetical protein